MYIEYVIEYVVTHVQLNKEERGKKNNNRMFMHRTPIKTNTFLVP